MQMKWHAHAQRLLPALVAVVVFAVGVLNIFSAVSRRSFSRSEFLGDIVSVSVLHASRTLVLLLGIFLIIIARGLLQRKWRSWWMATALIVGSIILHLLKGFGFEEGLSLFFPLLLLVFSRRLFVVQSGGFAFRGSVRFALYTLVGLVAFAFLGSFLLRKDFRQPVTPGAIMRNYAYAIFGVSHNSLTPKTRRARWFDDSYSTTGVVAILLIFGSFFAPVVVPWSSSDEERRRARALVLRYGRNSSSYLALKEDKRLSFAADGDGVIAYQIRNGTAVVLGDPIAKDEEKVAREFTEAMRRSGLSVTFLGVSEILLHVYRNLGFSIMKIGEEAVLETATFTTTGSTMAEIRHSVARMARENVRYSWYTMDEVPWGVVEAINRLHRSWLASKQGPPLTFSVDFFPFPVDASAWVLAVFSQQNELYGAFSFFPYRAGKGAALELMLRSSHSINGVVEAAIAESVRFFRERGVSEVSLGVAPLSDVGTKPEASEAAGRTDLLLGTLNRFYQYHSLFQFKKKFFPTWRHTYVAYRGYAELPKIATAVLAVHLKNGGLLRALLSRPKKSHA